jgi:hypothetical protein
VYSMVIEIDSFEVTGQMLSRVEQVSEEIERALSDAGRMLRAAEFDRLMWAMRGMLGLEWRWDHAADGVKITVRRSV